MRPETYGPRELVPVYQRAFSYYVAVPASFAAPALHTPAVNDPTQRLMAFVDFLIMWQMWSLKDIQGWAETAATISVTLATTFVLNRANARRTPDRIAQAGGTRWQKVVKVLNVVKEYADEVLEEVLYEPMFGEWLFTLFSVTRSGLGQKLQAELEYEKAAARAYGGSIPN